MTEHARIKWNTRKYKTQAEINEEINLHFGPKLVWEYQENGQIIKVYEGR